MSRPSLEILIDGVSLKKDTVRQIPVRAFWEFLRTLEIGAKKHGYDNIRKPIDRDLELEAFHRHFEAYRNGKVFDLDDGQHHLAACMFRASQLIEDDLRKKVNRPGGKNE